MPDMFQPQLTLLQDANQKLTLDATTLVPTTCWTASRAVKGTPPGVRILDTVESFLLNLREHHGTCGMVVHPVHHHLEGIALGPGKTSIVAWVMHGLKVLGSASIDVASALPGPHPTPTSDWSAWSHTTEPPTWLFVRGLVTTPTPGYEVALTPAVPQGINPAQLLLNLDVKALPGIWPQHVVQVPAVYRQQPFDGHVKEVSVRLPGGTGSVTFPVHGIFD